MIKDDEVGSIFVKQELVETSLVAIPANPNALAIAKSLGISQGTRKLVFAEHGDDDEPSERDDHIGEYAKLTELERWSPEEARRAKHWLMDLRIKYPTNPFYRKVYRLFDELETVRTISLVAAEHGTKGRAS
jgi:hypothetical protein